MSQSTIQSTLFQKAQGLFIFQLLLASYLVFSLFEAVELLLDVVNGCRSRRCSCGCEELRCCKSTYSLVQNGGFGRDRCWGLMRQDKIVLGNNQSTKMELTNRGCFNQQPSAPIVPSVTPMQQESKWISWGAPRANILTAPFPNLPLLHQPQIIQFSNVNGNCSVWKHLTNKPEFI